MMYVIITSWMIGASRDPQTSEEEEEEEECQEEEGAPHRVLQMLAVTAAVRSLVHPSRSLRSTTNAVAPLLWVWSLACLQAARCIPEGSKFS